MFEGMPRPLTEEEASVVVTNTLKEIDDGGLWGKECAECGAGIGGRLARYGKPTPRELERCACPECHAVGKVVLRYIPPVSQ